MPFGGALTVGLIGAGTSIFGGLFGSKAAKSAAQQQIDAANAAASGVTNAVNQVNPQISEAANRASEAVTNAAGDATGRVINTAADSARDARYAATDASGNIVNTAATAASNVNDAAAKANALLDPYSTTGGQAMTTLGKALAPGGDLTKTFTGVDLQNDPGYQFRLEQGQQAQERAAAAHGAVQGGGVMKSLERYAQGTASSEFQSAFDRFQKTQDSTYSRLSDLSKTGLAASGTMGSNLIGAGKYGGDTTLAAATTAGGLTTNAAQFSGNTLDRAAEVAGTLGTTAAGKVADYGTNAAQIMGGNTLAAATYAGNARMGAGNAQAAGTVGAANAWTGMLSGISTAASGVVQGRALNNISNGSASPGVLNGAPIYGTGPRVPRW